RDDELLRLQRERGQYRQRLRRGLRRHADQSAVSNRGTSVVGFPSRSYGTGLRPYRGICSLVNIRFRAPPPHVPYESSRFVRVSRSRDWIQKSYTEDLENR